MRVGRPPVYEAHPRAVAVRARVERRRLVVNEDTHAVATLDGPPAAAGWWHWWARAALGGATPGETRDYHVDWLYPERPAGAVREAAQASGVARLAPPLDEG